MISFAPLELDVLHAIFDETPEFVEKLRRQLAKAIILERQNTGLGFLTTMAVPDAPDAVPGPQTLGYTTYAQIDGLKYGLGFALQLKNGLLCLLDSHTCGGEDTSRLNISDVKFRISASPFGN